MSTLQRVAEVIERLTGVTYHPAHVWVLLRQELKWSWQGPGRRATERNDEAVQQWVKKRWPALKHRSKFLRDLNEVEQRKVLLISDGLRSHRSRRVSDMIAGQCHWLSVERMPGYVPDLNPIENVWGNRNLKSQELATLCSRTIDQVAGIAEGGLDRIGSDAALCFAFLHHSGLRL